jgi:hypothetical protein
LRRHRLADQDAAGLARHHHRAGIGRWPMTGIDRRSILRRQIGRIKNILERNRQATERQRREPRAFCCAPRAGEIERGESANILFAVSDRFGACFDELAGRQFAGFDAAGESESREHQAPSIRATIPVGARRT